MTLPFGIDVSKWQGINNFAKIKANTSFVLVKATESWGYTDPKFRANWQGLAGHNRVAYSYVWLSDDPLRQANHLIDTVTQAGVDWRYDRLALDLEKSGHGLSKAEVARRVIIMMERIREVTGRYPILYSRANWVDSNMLVTDPRIANADWWLAHYRFQLPKPLYTPEKDPPPALPNGVNNWLIHQTGERGNGSAVGVASHYVDTNRWNGTKQELLAYFGLTDDYEPLPPEPPEVQEPLFEAKVVTVYPHRLRTRYTPELGNNVRPEADWYKSGQVVSVYETKPDWYRTAVETWASAEWLRRLDYEEPPVLIDIPPLWQQDPRWKDILLGYSKTMTIGGWGCLIVTLAMRLGLMPDVVNERQKAVGGFTGANVYWQMVQVAFPQLTDFQYIECYWTPAPLDRIDSRLAEGVPVHVHVDLYNETASMEQHWVLIIGKNGDDYVMNDPWTGRQGSFREAYGDPARWIFRIASWRKL